MRYDGAAFSKDELDAGSASIDIFSGCTPRLTQQKFIASKSTRKMYIGQVGSGKTNVVCWQSLILSHMFPGGTGLVGRYTYRELADTTRKRFLELTDKRLIKNASIPEDGGGFIEWKVGGTTLFRNLDDDKKFGSLELTHAGCDEVTECPEKVWHMLEARCGRGWGPAMRGTYSPVFGGGNPAGQDWVWKMFYKEGAPHADGAFQPEFGENADALPPDYYDYLKKGKPEWWIRRFIYGDMRALEGLVWPMFDDKVNVIRPFPIPQQWTRMTGHDHGRNNPTACLWCSVDPEGNLIMYRDYQKAGPVPAEHCRNIRRLEFNEEIGDRVADPSMFSKTIPRATTMGNQASLARGNEWYSVADEYAEWGVSLRKGDNAMMASIERVASLLWADPFHAFPSWHPKAGRPGSPRLFIFKSCEQTIEDVSAWKFKEYLAERMGIREEPVDTNDHLPDCLRYICTTFPEPAFIEMPIKQITEADWQIDRKKKIGRRLRAQATQHFDNESGIAFDSMEDYT